MQGEEDCGRAGALSTAILATGDQSTGSDWMRKATCDERLAIGDWRFVICKDCLHGPGSRPIGSGQSPVASR
jgi:hypothetical protein